MLCVFVVRVFVGCVCLLFECVGCGVCFPSVPEVSGFCAVLPRFSRACCSELLFPTGCRVASPGVLECLLPSAFYDDVLRLLHSSIFFLKEMKPIIEPKNWFDLGLEQRRNFVNWIENDDDPRSKQF